MDWFVLQPLKWELKQKPGMSPPRGGFNPNDPNQQIVAEDIFDEYGGKFNYCSYIFFSSILLEYIMLDIC